MNNLITALVNRAAQERSVLFLAMAFRLNNPQWGSQAVLNATALMDYLNYLNWDLSHAQMAYPEWKTKYSPYYDEELMVVRTSQIRELAALVANPDRLELKASSRFVVAPELQELLVGLANLGVLHEDLSKLQNAGVGVEALKISGFEIEPDTRLHDLLLANVLNLDSVSLQEYVQCVSDADQEFHPNVVYSRSMQYLQKLAEVSNPFGARPSVPQFVTQHPPMMKGVQA